MADENGEFTYPRPNVIASSRGFSVEIPGRDTLWYAEEGRWIDIFAEQLVGDEPTISVRRSNVRTWQTPRGDIGVSDSEREMVCRNSRSAFDWKGWHFLVE